MKQISDYLMDGVGLVLGFIAFSIGGLFTIASFSGGMAIFLLPIGIVFCLLGASAVAMVFGK